MQWRGPYDVNERVGETDYRVQVGDKVKIYHINLLKKYHSREETAEAGNACVQDEDEAEGLSVCPEQPSRQQETRRDVNIGTSLTAEQRKQLEELLAQFSCIISGTTKSSTSTAETMRVPIS
jgi:hypothetical protein